MIRRDPERLEARIAVGAWALAAVVLVIALVAGASVSRAALLALAPLVLGAGAMFDAWRQAAGRSVALDAALATTQDDVTRAAAELDSLREATAQHDAQQQKAKEETRRELDEVRARGERCGTAARRARAPAACAS